MFQHTGNILENKHLLENRNFGEGCVMVLSHRPVSSFNVCLGSLFCDGSGRQSVSQSLVSHQEGPGSVLGQSIVGFVLDQVALGHVSFPVFWFFPVSIIPPLKFPSAIVDILDGIA
jgi:hypothetical protein